jgi:PAS domain-containing protein
MASRSTELLPVGGRVDRDGRLVAADPALERLQVEAGSVLGRAVALPQLAALARAAASLGVAVSRAVSAADSGHDLDLFVRAEPLLGDIEHHGEVRLIIERWVARPMAPSRLSLVEALDATDGQAPGHSVLEFETDAALSLIAMSPALADRLGVDPGGVVGRPLTSLFRLVEEADGSMPLLGAAAAHGAVVGQRAVPRTGGDEVVIDAQPSVDEQGRFSGFRAVLRGPDGHEGGEDRAGPFEDFLDGALGSPLARIITAADLIVERGDGPLRSDYASYANDIAAAGRHLLSVIRAMSHSGMAPAEPLDLGALTLEAIALVRTAAEGRGVVVMADIPDRPCRADGEARAVVQILVNIIGNAVRHSPPGGTVAVRLASAVNECRITVADQGPGIAPDDQQRIFNRYERVGTAPDGTGLGLAISRRLARSMGGDIRLVSTVGQGAEFILVLPAV